MSNETKKTALPKLRFPEFRDEPEWEETDLDEAIHSASNGLSIEQVNDEGGFKVTRIETISDGTIDLKRIGYIRTGRDISSYRLSVGDILFSNINSLSHIGKTVIVEDDLELYHGMNLLRLIVDKTKSHSKFLFFQLNTEGVRKAIKAKANIAVNQASINQTELRRTRIVLPKLGEQQKIAATLSSLDDLLTAQSAQLAALQAHKRGLLQGLFPAEGETVPKLRFPEFQQAPEWEEKKLGELCDFTRGPFGGALKKEFFVADGYAVYEQSHAIHNNFNSFRYYISDDKFAELKRFSVLPDDIIMSCSGTMGKFAIVPSGTKKGVINQALLKLRIKKGMNLNFIKTSLELPITQEKLLSQSAGGAIKNVVEVKQIKEISIFLPELTEQQKIADCLTALDHRIIAQTQKIEALQLHKKGLMQGLFPAAAEPTA